LEEQAPLRIGLIDYILLFYVPLFKECFTYMETSPISVKGSVQNLGLCSALRVFEQGRIFTVPHLL
jgi:hypothetical protein